MFNIQHLHWDSNFLGYKVAKIITDVTDELELIEEFEKLKKENYKLVTIHSSKKIDIFCNIKKKYNIFFDTKLTFIKNLVTKNIKKFDVDLKPHFYDRSIACNQLVSLAVESSSFSRFRRDMNFKRDVCDALFENWIKSSVKDHKTSKVVIVEDKKMILGMAAFHLDLSSGGIIDVISTHNKYRGMGIGRSLLSFCENYFLSENANTVKVSTQKVNLSACNFYKSCGYKIGKIENIVHLWL